MTASAGDLYLDLLESCLLGLIYEDPAQDPWSAKVFDSKTRKLGRDWPLRAHSMIGKLRMRNLRASVLHVINKRIPGDLIETGAWRGGACIYMRAILKAWGVEDRIVWVADSFEGLPPPDPEKYPADAGDQHHSFYQLVVSLEEVRDNFAKYGLLDDKVRFLKGWFKDTLPTVRPSKSWRCCVWTATCTSRPWTRSPPFTTRSLAGRRDHCRRLRRGSRLPAKPWTKYRQSHWSRCRPNPTDRRHGGVLD